MSLEVLRASRKAGGVVCVSPSISVFLSCCCWVDGDGSEIICRSVQPGVFLQSGETPFETHLLVPTRLPLKHPVVAFESVFCLGSLRPRCRDMIQHPYRLTIPNFQCLGLVVSHCPGLVSTVLYPNFNLDLYSGPDIQTAPWERSMPNSRPADTRLHDHPNIPG